MSSNSEIAKSIKWASFSKVIRIVLQYVTLMVLVAYLSPKDFGLMSTAMIFVGFFNLIRDFGFSAAIIQLSTISEELLSSVFWLNNIIGISFSIIIFFSSSLISSFYNAEELKVILQVLSINFFMNGIIALQNALLEKELKFDLLARVEIVAFVLASLVAIFLAINNYGVWALVFQTLSASFIILIQLWLYSSFKPKLIFKLSEVKKIYAFGLNLSGFNILNYFVRNADYFLIGKFIGMEELGIYSLAYRIMLFPIQNITSVVSRVLFPALSKIKNNNSEMSKTYINVSKIVAFITFPLMIGFFVVNENFVKVFFDVEWYSIIDLLYILVPIGMMQSVYSLAGAIYQSKNKTKEWFYWGIFSAIITVCGFYYGLSWGIIGVAISYLITNLILIYPGSLIPFRYIGLKVSKYLMDIAPNLVISIFMGVIVFVTKKGVEFFNSDVISLILSLISGISSYLILSLIFNKDIFKKIISNLSFK